MDSNRSEQDNGSGGHTPRTRPSTPPLITEADETTRLTRQKSVEKALSENKKFKAMLAKARENGGASKSR